MLLLYWLHFLQNWTAPSTNTFGITATVPHGPTVPTHHSISVLLQWAVSTWINIQQPLVITFHTTHIKNQTGPTIIAHTALQTRNQNLFDPCVVEHRQTSYFSVSPLWKGIWQQVSILVIWQSSSHLFFQALYSSVFDLWFYLWSHSTQTVLCKRHLRNFQKESFPLKYSSLNVTYDQAIFQFLLMTPKLQFIFKFQLWSH